MVAAEERELGNVMDLAINGAFAHITKLRSQGELNQMSTIVALRDELRSMNLEPEASPPSSEVLIEQFLAAGEVIRGSLAWEFLAVLVCRCMTPWSVLDRRCLHPPLEFRFGESGETIPDRGGVFDCHGFPVLADSEGAKASPWTCGQPGELEGCSEPVFISYLPKSLFRAINPKGHLGRVVWLTWAYRFVFERRYS
jgi:DNA/RNA-binding domain of Phe-tRNA-synthetase-like protein